MRLRPIEHLENRRPKCKMHTQERQLTRFLYFTTDLQRKPNRTDGSELKPKPNPQLFSKPNQAQLEKSIQHIPKIHCMD